MDSPFIISGGKTVCLNISMTCVYSTRTLSISLYFCSMTSSMLLKCMNSSIMSEEMYQVLGMRNVVLGSAAFFGFLQDLRSEEKPGALTAEPSVALP